MTSAPSIHIGMPVFQGGSYIATAIRSLQRQTLRDWHLSISDNASSDATQSICEEFAMSDGRISYSRQPTNLGAEKNFIRLAREPKISRYFMWAAVDDEWSPDYLAACADLLDNRPDIGFVGGDVSNIDPFGNVIREYRPVTTFTSPNAVSRVSKWTLQRDIDGKPNMIYAVYRSALIEEVCRNDRIMDGWGADMGIVLAALSRAPFAQVHSVMFFKRVTRQADIETCKAVERGDYTKIDAGGHFPATKFVPFVSALLRGVPAVHLKLIIILIMLFRLPVSAGWSIRRKFLPH